MATGPLSPQLCQHLNKHIYEVAQQLVEWSHDDNAVLPRHQQGKLCINLKHLKKACSRFIRGAAENERFTEHFRQCLVATSVSRRQQRLQSGGSHVCLIFDGKDGKHPAGGPNAKHLGDLLQLTWRPLKYKKADRTDGARVAATAQQVRQCLEPTVLQPA
jgi:hypothetical protein